MLAQNLLTRLNASIEGMGLNRIQLGFPELIIKEVKKAETLFKDFAKAQPSKQDAYQAALRLLRGEKLDDWTYDLAAAAVSIPISELHGLTVLESDYCDVLLKKYENDARSGNLWRLTWYSLLNSYLTYAPTRATTENGMQGFHKLRDLLNTTWPVIDKQSGELAVPDWVRILREERQLLTDKPVQKYAQDYLLGKTNHVEALAENLGIPPNSWFWQELVLDAIQHATLNSDEEFHNQIPMLIKLLSSNPVYRDRGIVEILVRYYKCSSKPVHPLLRDFVINASVWKNPKLKAAGIATAWNQVPEAVWRMVLGWVNERNLKDFFDILASRSHADHGRLKFWSQYMKQISWTRLVFGAETIWQKTHNAGIRALLESEEGAYATLQGSPDKELDAFLMQIGEYIFVEFSKSGNGAYAYRASDLPFHLHASIYSGTTSDLKSGFYSNGKGVAKIIHRDGWQKRTTLELSELGIHPDRLALKKQYISSNLNNEPADTANQADSQYKIDQIRKAVSKYKGAQLSVVGSAPTRRLWISNPHSWVSLENELKKMGFRWAAKRQSWYWNES